MSSKTKGTNAERDLLHMLWDSGFAVSRMAGSGSIPLPSPDLIASNSKKIFAIECKHVKKTKYFSKQEISELKLFAKRFGAVPIIAIKFNHKGWFFLNADKLDKSKTGNNYVISYKIAKKKGMNFNKLIN